MDDPDWMDSSWKKEAPLDFTVGRAEVIYGVDEGVVGMTVASERRLIVPPQLAFADHLIAHENP